MLTLINLKCDNQHNPNALSTPFPRFGWQLISDHTNVLQSSYRIRVWKEDDFLCWDSKLQTCGESAHILYQGLPLEANTGYTWQVEMTDNYGESTLSEMQWFTTSFFDQPWQAKWIYSGEENPKGGNRPVEVFQKKLYLNKEVSKVTVRISAMGLYKLSVNGIRVSEDYFTPGYTSYAEYIQYQTYDITHLTGAGEQNLSIALANGWYCGRIMFKSNVYGKSTALIAEIEAKYTDGSKMTWVTDESWSWSKEGPIRFADFYDGESYDANRVAIPENTFRPAVQLQKDKYPKLVPHFGAIVRRQLEVVPIRYFKNKYGELIYDLGQNFGGWVRLKVSEQKGTIIRVSHSEILDPEERLEEGSHGGAKSILEYTCSGEGEEIYEPTFTSMGFRYVKVEGTTNADLHTVTGIAAYSDMELTGDFRCSNEMVNKLWQNVLWSQRSNFIEIPTDCPQRSERLGWLGDIALFARTACFNMDISLFIRKWLNDLSVEFEKFGKISFITPDIGMMGPLRPAVAGWGDAAVMVPWKAYLAYGDKSLLEHQYPSMKKWVETERRNAAKHSRGHKKYIWSTGFQFGDWLAPQGNALDWMKKKKWLSTAYFAFSTGLLTKAAEVLGKQEDVKKYQLLYNNIKDAFCREFVNPDGTLKGEFQSGYACALYFDLLPSDLKEKSAKRLADLIKENNGCLSTGFLGTPYLTFALSDNNQLEAAYQLLLNDKCPSWMYPIKKGATTMWECWDLMNEDGTLKGTEQGKRPKMIRSFNHYAYGSVCDWLHRRIAGLEALEPGYSHFKVKPMPGGGLTDCSLSYKSLYGEIKILWEIKDQVFHLTVTVPANSKATVILPDGFNDFAGSGTWNYSCKLS